MENIATTHIVVGELETNCYIISDLEKRNCVVIDPGAEGEKILEEIRIKDLKLEAVINTHGHMDHIGGNGLLLDETGCKLYIHEADRDMLKDPTKNLSVYSGQDITSPDATDILKEGQILEFGNIRIKIIHTPGHSPGSVSILLDKRLFSGDTLFKKSIGRTDFTSSDYGDIISSIKKKLLILDGQTEVFPGHGEETTISYEKNNNPFV